MMTFRDRGEAHLRRKLGVTDAGEGGDRAVRERTRLRPYAVVDLHPGELLMLPASWYHRVECLTEEPCQSVSIFWPNPNSIACSQKIGHFFPHIMSDTPSGFCNAPEVYNRTVSAPQPPELDSLKAARDACGGAMPKDGGGAGRAPAACLGALADWHYFLLAMAAAHLRHFPPLLALHPELEAGGTDLERARLFVRMVYRSRYAAHTMEQLRGLRMPFACDREPGGGEAAPECPHLDGLGAASRGGDGRREAMDKEAEEIAREALFNWKWEEIDAHFRLIPVPEGVGDAEAYRLDRVLTHYGGVVSLQLSSLIDMYPTVGVFEDARSVCRFLRCVAETPAAAL